MCVLCPLFLLPILYGEKLKIKITRSRRAWLIPLFSPPIFRSSAGSFASAIRGAEFSALYSILKFPQQQDSAFLPGSVHFTSLDAHALPFICHMHYHVLWQRVCECTNTHTHRHTDTDCKHITSRIAHPSPNTLRVPANHAPVLCSMLRGDFTTHAEATGCLTSCMHMANHLSQTPNFSSPASEKQTN